MTGDRKENPTRHRLSARRVDVDQQDTNSEATDGATRVGNFRPHYSRSGFTNHENGTSGDSLWVTQLLNQLDKERDARRTESTQAKPAENRHADGAELSTEANREICRGSADTGEVSQSPTLSQESFASNDRRTAWPYAKCGVAALTLVCGITALIEFRRQQDTLDTTDRQATHSPMSPAPATPSAGLRKLLDIPLTETVTVLAPEKFAETDASPSSASTLNGDAIEVAAIVSSPGISPAVSVPRHARISLPQGPTVRILAPPKPLITDANLSVEVTAHNAASEEGPPIDRSPGGVRTGASSDAGSYREAGRPTQGEPTSEAARTSERSKPLRPRTRSHTGIGFSKLRREARPALPHLARADRLRNFTLPSLLRPTPH
ncbi:hypothetical protein J2W76_001917 [Methylorubrum zatmanii]|nr:hypothetical protein [Methylorubrum zatmanii]MCP1554714.1 hypothetical protein [Methylorubrum extorquens]MCP1578975.1 hypothetical protein [Methylorubrum extorquens]